MTEPLTQSQFEAWKQSEWLQHAQRNEEWEGKVIVIERAIFGDKQLKDPGMHANLTKLVKSADRMDTILDGIGKAWKFIVALAVGITAIVALVKLLNWV